MVFFQWDTKLRVAIKDNWFILSKGIIKRRNGVKRCFENEISTEVKHKSGLIYGVYLTAFCLLYTKPLHLCGSYFFL